MWSNLDFDDSRESNDPSKNSSIPFMPPHPDLPKQSSSPVPPNLMEPNPPSVLQEIPSPYNIHEIRELMTNCFRDRDLKRIAFDYKIFRPVYDEFSSEMGKDDKIDIFLEYADRYVKIDELLLVLKEKNPDCYSRYEAKIGTPQRITRGEKTIVVVIRANEMTKDEIGDLVKGVANEFKVEARSVYVKFEFTAVASVPRQKIDELQVLNSQRQLENLKDKYDLNKMEVVDGSIKLSSSSGALTRKETEKFLLEIADKLGVAPQEIRLEYSESTLITIALPGEKADSLLKLDQEGKLEEWKKRLGIKQLEPENSLDRYVQLVATLIPSAEASLLKKTDKLKRIIADGLGSDLRQVRLPTWDFRFLTFILVLPSQMAAKLKSDNQLQLKTIYVRKDKEVIHATLVSAIDNSNANVSYSRNYLAQKLSIEIAEKLCIEPNEVEISWLDDSVIFSFVLPSRFAEILLYHYSKGNLKKFLDFEIQNLHIGQYDWNNYLGLVPVTSE